MSLFDADMIDIKSQKSAPDHRQFCYNSLRETQNSASAAMHRCQEGHDMLNMQNCAFRSVIRGKSGVATMHQGGLKSPNMQYFSSESTISGCDTSGQT